METSLLQKVDIEYHDVCGLSKQNENTTLLKHRSTVIKYTKLPTYESDFKVLWHQQKYCRLRLFTTLNDYDTRTNRSSKSNILFPTKMTSGLPKRKIAIITEDDENDLHPNFSRESKRSSLIKTSNRSVATDYKEEKLTSTRNTSRFSTTSKYASESKGRTKINNTKITKEMNVIKPANSKKYSNLSSEHLEHGQLKYNKDGINRNFKKSNVSKTSVSKNIVKKENENELSFVNTKLLQDVKSNVSPTQSIIEKPRTDNSSAHIIKSKVTFLKQIQTKNKPLNVIRVPIEKNNKKINVNSKKDENLVTKNQSCSVYEVKNYKNVNLGTEPPPTSVDQITDMDGFQYDGIRNYSKDTHMQTEKTIEIFDSLEIPNVTLTKEKYNSKEEDSKADYKSLPNIQLPSTAMSSDKDFNDEIGLSFCTSYIISRATLTYTTQQKINFHMVESKESNDSPTIQTTSPLFYPANVVSVFKNEIKRNRDSNDDTTIKSNISNKLNKTKVDDTKHLNEVKSFNCSYGSNSKKLMKPSDIIGTIKINTGFLQSNIPDEFQRELNFIDSFFESLQYLENSSLSTKCFTNEKVDNLVYSPKLFKNIISVKDSDYNSLCTKWDNDGNMDDTETMTSKSLCLLNSLIRDEQRRAKNLLFVLKMREDALKEFATSQILWLENKKKHDNTDVSVLKKKQRGALLKLQHECGEMQRMRKTLLTLSEKRKVALMKTKKSLELKLKNNVNVDQIVLGKKKLKKCMSVDRNTAPLKCFDLSSSGCDESSTSRHNSEIALFDAKVPSNVTKCVQSSEKSIQTGDSDLLVDKSTEMAAENFVVVDGGYLNILFHNLSLPQIFSGGKQYEVNEEALKNIVNSSNTQNSNVNMEDIEAKIVDNNKCRDGSSSPSTARSLIEEFDQYYKGLDGDKSFVDSSDQDIKTQGVVYDIKDSSIQVCTIEECDKVISERSDITATSDSAFSVEQSCMCEALDLANSSSILSHNGPLPVPVGAAAHTDITGADITMRPTLKSISTSTISESDEDNESVWPIVPSLSSPVLSEAEELRRQQLAIEREIKALEQQQCQLLVVREIPDKPPPPYKPPIDSRITKPSPLFHMDNQTDEKIKRLIIDPIRAVPDDYDTFDVFLRDFCSESLEKCNSLNGDQPWDACNLQPQKRHYDTEKLIERTSSELSEVLNGVAPTVVSGVGARRSDHIDDILFAEWRRCEPEWTSLHTDEAIVKNQIFDCIFQKILTETVDEYKKVVKSDNGTE